MQRWIYSRDGETFGPTDMGGLRQLARSMHLLPDSKVRQHGRSDAVLASSIAGLCFVAPDDPADGTPQSKFPDEMDQQYLAEQARSFLLYALCGTVLVFVLALFTLIAGSMP